MELVDEQTQTLAAGIASRDADELLHGLQEMLKVMADPQQGGRVLRQYVLASPKCVELLTAWEGGSGAPTAVPLMLLISEMLRHPMGKGEVKSIDGANNTDTKAIVILQARLDKLARTIARTKLKDIYSHLSSSQRSRQKAALKLMSSVVLRGKLIAVEVATNFDFTLEALKKLAQHPFKALVVKATQGLLNHSARFFFIEFALSFLVVGDPGLLRWILQKRPLYAGVFHGLAKDEESTIIQVLFVIQEKVMAPAALVPTGLQSAVFGDVALEQLARIAGDELFGDSADLAYKILTSLCTDPSHGLCPEVSSTWEPVNAKAGAFGGNQGRLLRLMLRLRVTEVVRHRELLLATARVRPKLAAAYLDSVPFSLEPRPSPTWFSAMSLVAELIKISSVPPPFSLMASQGLPVPVLDGPLIRSTLRRILPRTLTKVALNRGLQHVNVLTKHACLRVLLEALLSLEILLDAAFTAANTLSSSKETGSSISEANCSSKKSSVVTGTLIEERRRIGEEAFRDEKELKKLEWLKLVEDIQDTMRATLPDPNILLIIYSTLNSSNFQPSDGMQKKRTQNVEGVPGGKRRKKDKGYTTEEGNETSLVNNVDEIKSNSEVVEGDQDTSSSEAQTLIQIWGVTAQGDTQSLLHAKVLELLAVYQRVLPVAFADKGFDPFKLLPSDPMQLSLLQQEAFLSLLLSTTGNLQKGSPKNNSTLKFVDLSGSGLMYKHVKPLLKMIVGSNVERVRNSAYVLASRFMLSTGAFDSNAWEATMWLDHLLRLEGITSNSSREGLLDETHSNQSSLGHIGDVVVGFLSEAVGTVGRTLYKHLDQLFTLLSANSLEDGSIDVHYKSSGLVAPEFGPFVICALEHTLRVLRSDSKSLSTPHRAAISLYVASVLNHLLQIQTNTRALGGIIRSLLSPDFHSNTGDLQSGDIAWVPLQTLYWRACFLLNEGSATLEPQLKFSTVKTSDQSGQLRKILTACKGKEKGEKDDDDDISRQRDELVSSLVCAPVDEVSKNFILIAEVLPKICRGNVSILMSICGLHDGLLTEVDVTSEDFKKAKDRFFGRQLIVSYLLMRFSSTESCRLDPSSAVDSEKKVSAIYNCLRSLPFSVLLSAVMDNKEGKIFTREILLCALRSAYASIPLQDRPVVMRMVLSFIHQLRFSTRADSDKSLCLETCFTFLKKLVVPSETWSSGEDFSSEEISVCKLMVRESLAHPALAGFCMRSKTRKKSVRLFDAYISDYLKSLLEACSLLELHGKSSSVAQLLGSLQEMTFSFCKPHIERAMTLFLHGVNSRREPDDGIKPKSTDFDSVHSIVTELAPYAGPQEFLHFISDLISCKDVEAPRGGVSLSSLCLEFCRTFFKSCPRIKFKPENVRAVTQELVLQIFRFVVKEALRSCSEEGDLCLLSALQTPIFFGVSSFANSSQFSHLVSLTPIEVLKYCVQQPSITRSKIARTLVEASTVHRGEFGNLLIKEPTDSGKKLETLNMASKFLQDQELLQEQSSEFFILSDDDLLLLLPAVEVFLAKSYSRPATKVVITVASVYLKVLRKQFKSWNDFVDKFPILTDMSLSILGVLKGAKNITGEVKFAGSFWWEVVKIFKHCLQICPWTSKECMSLLRKLLPKNELPLADLNIDILKGPESGICNVLLEVYGKVAVVKQILLNMQAQGDKSDTLLLSENGKKKSQAGDIIVRFAANLVSTLGTLFKLTTELEMKPTTSFSVSGVPDVAKVLEDYLQVELLEVVDILTAHQFAEPEIVAVFQTFAKTCLRYKFGKVCGMKVLCAFALHLLTCNSKIDEFSVQVRDVATCVLDLLLAHSQFVPYLISTHTLSKSLPLNLGRHAGKGTVLSSLPSILSMIGSPVVHPVEKNSTIISEEIATRTESLKSPIVDSKDNKPADDLEGEILILVKLLQLLFQLKMHSNEELSLPSEDLVMLEDLLSMLLAAYGATTSIVDLEILALMRQLELCGGKGFSGLVGMDFLWGEAALKRRRARANEQAQAVDADMDSEENMLEDRKRMFREDLAIDPRRSGLSVLFFPATTQLLMSNAPKNGVKAKGLQGDVYDVEEQRLRMAAYDPNYFLPFALHGLSVGCIDAEEFVRLGILAVAMASLSSSNEDMRKLGYEVLAKYLTVLEEGPSFKGQPQIRLLLTYVKNAITEPWQQLPFVLMLFAAEASCILVHPESPHYLTITRYLLKGPSMDLEYVPLFHSMFGSGSPRYRSERLWMLRLLACGLTSYQDSRVYRRQFVLQILMSFYSSPLADTFTRKWVLQVIQKAARIRPCVQTLVERAGLLPWLALAAVNARDFIVSEQDGTETNDLEAMALEVIETVMRWRFMEQRSLGEGMEELSTVALGLHHFLTHSDTTCKQRATFRRPTLRIMTFALRLSQRRKKYQTHFSLSLQGILDVIQWVESEGSDSGFDIETSQETRALALQMLLQCSTPAASTHEDKQLLCQIANWAIPVAIQVLTTSEQSQTGKYQAGKGIEHRVLESPVEKLARWLAATLLLGKQANSDGNKHRYFLATSSTWWSILMENTPSPCMGFHPLNVTLANPIMELQRHIVGDGGFFSIVASLAALWPFSAPFAEDKLQVDDPRHIAKNVVDRLLTYIPAPQEADPSWRWSFNNAWRSKQILESLKTPDKLAMVASSFQTEICRVLIIVFQQLLLDDTLELHRVICQWRKGLGDTSPEQQFCSKGFFERLSSVIEELHRDTNIQ